MSEARTLLEEDFRLLFEASPDVLLVLLPDAPRFTMVAATNARLAATHTTREQIVGRPLFELFPDNPDDPNASGASNLRASLERVIATRAPDSMAVQKYDIRRADGTFEVKYWSPKNVPVLSPSGELRFILHRVEDVTELVRATELGDELRGRTREMEREVIARSQELAAANRDLRAANERLGELNAAKTAFFNNVSHELRTPLTLVLAPIEDALARPSPNLSGEDLEATHRNALRLARLVNSLLDFSRIEAGRLKPAFEPTDLAVLTAGLAASFESLVESAGLRLVVDCPPLRGPVHVDPAHWEKIVLNLVSNAFKFTFEGEIAVRLRERADSVELVVSDTGTGIPEHEHARIFERFHRVEGARGRSFEGTGIGLALVQELVALHGGSIRVDSAVGKGTSFTVAVPARTNVPSEPAAIAAERASALASAFVREAAQWLPERRPAAIDESAPPSEHTATRDDYRLLVVDDNADMRGYLSRLLRPHWTVDCASDGEEALAAATRSPPDLIVSDVMMPRMDGFALLRALRSSPATRSIPVILLSARAGDAALVQGFDLGADDFLLKPFSPRELISRIRSHLDLARARTSALRASETRFRRLVESGIIGVCVADASGLVLEANDAFLAMLGCGRADLAAGALRWPKLASAPEHSKRVAVAEGSEKPWETELVRRDGSRVPALVARAPLDGGESMLISLDLSERKHLEEQFRQAQKMEAVGRLAGGIAHDFNNLLSVILTYSEFATDSLRPEDPLRADIEEIRSAGRRATELTGQLLSFSRQQVRSLQAVDLNSIVGGMEKLLRRLLGEDIELAIVAAHNLASVSADPAQIEQVVMNLAVNARDAMPKGGKLVIETANTSLDEEYARAHFDVKAGPYVMLAVSDTGVGMDKRTLARVFEPFFTTKDKGKGTGLGLATVFGIVKQSGGHIVVESEPRKGSTFKLYFPRVSASTAKAAPERAPAEPERGTETILLVEDDDQVRAIARGILRRNGYVVLEAANGGEALLVCEQHESKIDLLLTDVVLPRMNGRQIAARLTAMRPDMKVAFMSGYTDEAVLQHDALDSSRLFVQKPLTPTTLARMVRQALRDGTGR